MVPLLSWFRRVSHTATSGTLVTPSVIIIIPGTNKKVQIQTLTQNKSVKENYSSKIIPNLVHNSGKLVRVKRRPTEEG